MKLTLADTKLLKDSVSIIADLVTEVQFSISKESVEVIAMDPINVAMVSFKLLSSAFTEYNIKEETKLAVNLNDLKAVLKRAKSTDIIILESDSNKLKITFKGKTKREFELPLIDLEEKSNKVPPLEFNVTINTLSSTLTEAIEDVDIIGESVTFKATKDTFLISASNDLSKANIEIKADEGTSITIKEESEAKYSLDYLKKMINGSKLSDKVTIKFKNDYPLMLEYAIVDKLILNFILAPRVAND